MDTVEISAKTIEEATEVALRELDAERVEVAVEVVSRGRTGLFGIGSEPVHRGYGEPRDPAPRPRYGPDRDRAGDGRGGGRTGRGSAAVQPRATSRGVRPRADRVRHGQREPPGPGPRGSVLIPSRSSSAQRSPRASSTFTPMGTLPAFRIRYEDSGFRHVQSPISVSSAVMPSSLVTWVFPSVTWTMSTGFRWR